MFIVLGIVLLFVSCNSSETSSEISEAANDSAIVKEFEKIEYLFNTNQNKEGVSLINETFNKFPTENKKLLTRKYLRLAEINASHFQNYSLALNYLDSADLYIDRSRSDMIDDYILKELYKGKISFQLKEMDLSYMHYYAALKIIDSLNDPCRYLYYYVNIGELFWLQNKYDEFIDYVKKSLVNQELCNEFTYRYGRVPTIQSQYSNIAIAFERIGKYDSAIYYNNIAIDSIISQQNKSLDTHSAERLLGVVLGNKGGVLLKQKKYEEAEKVLTQSIALNDKKTHEKGDALFTKIKLLNVFIETNRLSKANTLIKEIEQTPLEYTNQTSRLRMQKIYEKYYEKKGDYKLAKAHLEAYNKIYDSTQNDVIASLKSNSDILKNYDKIEGQHKIVLLEEKGKSQQFILYTIFFFLCSLIVFIVIIQRSHNRFRKQAKEIKAYNEKLQKSMVSLENSYTENKRILKVVAHDLRSPIAGIMSIVRLMKFDEDIGKDELNEYISMVEKAGNNALEFIEDLLLLNKENETLEKHSVDILQVLQSCVEMAKSAAIAKKQTITLEAKSVKVKINEQKIWRVINNLLSNAIKFSYPNTSIAVNSIVQDNHIIISVKDSGTGISEEMKPRIFSQNIGVGQSGTSGEHSFGLGLAISKQIVDAHKGKIWFETTIGKGTTFYVELPIS